MAGVGRRPAASADAPDAEEGTEAPRAGEGGAPSQFALGDGEKLRLTLATSKAPPAATAGEKPRPAGSAHAARDAGGASAGSASSGGNAGGVLLPPPPRRAAASRSAQAPAPGHGAGEGGDASRAGGEDDEWGDFEAA